MKTNQEQIEKMARIMCGYCSTDGKCAVSKNLREPDICANVDTEHCLYKEHAERLFENGCYGDISEYKAENERLTKILNILTFSEKETDIFGKPALLMFAGIKVEEAIKRVAEYDGLNAEIERLRTTLGQCNTELNSALESLKSQCREIGELKAKIKQAQIDVLNELRERITKDRVANDTVVINVNYEIKELIQEVENEQKD